MIKTIPNLICFGGGSIKLSTISVLFNFPTITQIFTNFYGSSLPKDDLFQVPSGNMFACSVFGSVRICSVFFVFRSVLSSVLSFLSFFTVSLREFFTIQSFLHLVSFNLFFREISKEADFVSKNSAATSELKIQSMHY